MKRKTGIHGAVLRRMRAFARVFGVRFFSCVVAALSIGNASAQTMIPWWVAPFTFSNGGGTSGGGQFTFSHTIGQQVIGNVSGGIYTAELGFWPQVIAAPPDTGSLPPLIVLETFDGVPEGSLPPGWSISNRTTVVTAGLDLSNPNSDSYLNWVVISSNRLATIFGTNRLNFTPANVNGQLVTSLVSGNLAYAESDLRSGHQVQVLFSPDYDLSNRRNVHLSFHSIYTQNQDSSASVEYSIDGGSTWLPALYMVDQNNIILDGVGGVDAVATLTTARSDQAYGLSFGTWIGAPISPALAPLISGRVNDDQVESKRIEAIRLPQADHQSTVRLRFAQSGTASWYFGVDNVGLYGELHQGSPPAIVSQPQSRTVAAGQSVTFTVGATGTLPLSFQWLRNGVDLPGQTTSNLTINSVQLPDNGSTFSVRVGNGFGSLTSLSATLTVTLSPQVDLAVSMVASPNPVTDTSNLTYTVAVTNRGGGTATGVMLTVPLPSGITFVSATASQGSCSNTANGVACSLGTLAPGGMGTISVVGIPDYDIIFTALNIPETQETIIVTNAASVTSLEVDTTPANNTGAATALVVPLRDFSDAPDSYHTLASSNGPRHRIRPGWRLGALADPDTNGMPTVPANGDDTAGSDDEDGVMFITPTFPTLMASNVITVTVPAGSNAYVNAWYDFNRNGVFDGAAERVITDLPVTSGTFTQSFLVPPGAVAGPTYARFRLSAVPGLSPEGPTSAGEVEDYALSIVNDPPTVTMTSPLNGSSYNVGAAITLTAIASASNGKTIASVTFVADGTDLVTLAASPYTTSVSTLTAGTHVLHARVTDSDGLTAVSPAVTVTQIYPRSTYSSPIAVSKNDRLIWVVNPSDDSVSVIRPDNNTRITKISVGDEPESIALTPDGQYAYVANAAGNGVTIIRINDPAWGTFSASVANTLTTGAEPWNIVASPDGLRVFVANSGQDTITVINAATRAIIGHVDLRNSIANDPDRSRHFQPRGLAVTGDNTKLYVTRFLSFTKPGGRQGDDLGKEGLVAVLDINTSSLNITDYSVARTIPLEAQVSGFRFPGLTNDTAAFPNQLQSIVIRGDRAYLPNIAASPTGPLRFNLDTHAFINQIGAVNGNAPTDLGALNLHLGARDPVPGKRKLFFANPWAIAFTTQSGVGNAYAVSAGSDLLVKLNVAADDSLSFTVDGDTTGYIDLNEPTNSVTSGIKAGKNPQGIALNSTGTVAYVANFVSRNVSVVDLTTDTVIATVQTSDLPAPGSQSETNLVGAEMFFSSRGNFDVIPGTNSLRDRLSSEGWQSCAGCHFKGLTDGVIWQFNAGPRKSVPLNSSFNPLNRNQQRVLNYSAIFDEIEDFEINVRGVSGPGNLATPINGNPLDPNHGLLIGPDGDLNVAPASANAFTTPNANRDQVSVTLSGSTNRIPVLTAMREWVRFEVRTPNAPVTALPNAPAPADIAAGRTLVSQAGCANCHGGQNWTISLKDFISPPSSAEIFTERTGTFTGNPVGAQYLNRFLRDIGSFNLGVPGQGNPLGNNIGADEKAARAVVGGVLQPAQDALGMDYNADGKGIGFNVPSLLGIYALPPFLHNGAAESLGAVVADVKHRTDNGRMADLLSNPADQARVVKFLESIDVRTVPLDTTPPVIACPTGIVATATTSPGVVVNFTVAATDTVDPAPVVVCTPSSGSVFPIGTTQVSCVARDASGNASSCTFPVNVSGPIFGGFEHVPVAGASVNLGSNQVGIANLGTNGQDGVRIVLGQADGWRATILHHIGDSNRAVGSRIEWTVLGEKNGQPNQPLIYGRLERGQDGPVLYADGSLVGATTFDLEVLSNDVVIVRTSVPSGYIHDSSSEAILRLIATEFYHVAWQGLTGPQDGWYSFIAFDPASPFARLVLRIRPTSMTATVGKFSEVQLRGLNSGNFSLRDEAVSRLGAYLQAGDGTTFQSESNRVRFLAGSNSIAHAGILAPETTNTMNRSLAFYTPGIALTALGSAVTFSASDAAETFSLGSLTLRREVNGRLAVGYSSPTQAVGRVVAELFNSSSVVERLSLSPGNLGTLSGAGRIVTAGMAATRVPVLSVVFDAPITFSPIGLPVAGGQVTTGLRFYPGKDSEGLTWSSLDRFDVETVNEPLMEWNNRVIVWSPSPTRPTLGRLTAGAHPRLSFATEPDVEYVVQSWDDLAGIPQDLWYVPSAGNGGEITVEDLQPATAPARFYRIVPTRESLWEGLRGQW